MKFICFVVVISFYNISFSQNNSIGIFDKAADIGKPKNAGSSRYDEATQTYHIRGSGNNIWFNRDEFQYLYKKISGNFLLTVDFEFARWRSTVYVLPLTGGIPKQVTEQTPSYWHGWGPNGKDVAVVCSTFFSG